MHQINRIFSLFFLLISSICANTLEIKIDQQVLNLPYWQGNNLHYGAVLLVSGDSGQCSDLLPYFSQQLAKNGWSVVLLNCIAHSAPLTEQIPEVISVLRQQKNTRIVLIHYGEQLNQSLDYFSKPQSKMINGLVMLSAYNVQNDSENITNLRFPLFDVIGQFDYDSVLTQKKERAKAFKDHHYLAVEMPGAHHDYQYSQKLLVAFIHGWMSKLPEIKPQPKPIQTSYIVPIYFPEHPLALLNNSDD